MSGGNKLRMSSGDHVIQAFPLIAGNVKLTSADGAKTDVSIIHCYADGDFTITWEDGTTDNIVCLAGEDYTIEKHDSLIVVNGTFHIA